MKKLAVMTSAALMAAVGFADGIQSANVVGYTTKSNTVSGFNFYAPSFVSVGTESVNLQDVKLDFGENECQGLDNIQILDDGGATVSTYVWMPADWTGLDADGWVNEEGTALADITLAPGQGILIDIVDDGTSVVNAGEVSDVDASVEAVAGFNFVGNSSPVAINIQDIKLDFGENESQGLDNIQILDDGGATVATYVWMPADWTGLDADGWVNEEGTALANITLAPGQGILVDIVDDGTNIILPSAL